MLEIELEGFEEFGQQLSDMSKMFRADLIARNTLTRAAKEAMVPVFNTAQSLAHYDYNRKTNYDKNGKLKPHMKDTLRLDARTPNENDRESYYVSETDAVIAVVSVKKSAVSLANEYGTADMSSNPFLRPAFESNIDRVLAALKSELSYLIPAYAKKLQRPSYAKKAIKLS